jgi:hypothetical protein
MRKSMTCHPRGLAFRLLLVVAGALLLAAAFAPRAHAQALIAYWNFEDSAPPPGAVNLQSDAPGLLTTNLIPGGTFPYLTTPDIRTDSPGFQENIWPQDPIQVSTKGMGLAGSGRHNPPGSNPPTFDISLFNAQNLVFKDVTLSLAINREGNGFTFVAASFSTDGGMSFTLIGSPVFLPNGPTTVPSFFIANTNGDPLILRLTLTGGQSNGINLQNVIDNITVVGTVVPEPATVAGGLLGVLGLCWFQRRRLIRSACFRHTSG